jgi:DNA-binding LytR/AlgR family response regulator
MTPKAPTALIAEDEHLLAAALQPDVLFFDIRMPGMGGLEAAAELADVWPTAPGVGSQTRPFPALVFVTAYDQYAVQAFEAQAVDYLLKPLQTARLQKTVAKLPLALAKPAQAAMDLEATLAQLRGLLAPPQAHRALLRMIQVSVGSAIRMVCRWTKCCTLKPPTNTCVCSPPGTNI